MSEPNAPLPTDAVALLPMRNLVMFPHVLTPLTVGRERSLAAVTHALEHARGSGGDHALVGVLLQRDPKVDEPAAQDLYEVGTLARIVRHTSSEHGVQHLVCQGVQRFRVTDTVSGWPFLAARIERLGEGVIDTTVEAAGITLRERAGDLLGLLPAVPAEVAHALQATRSPLQ